MRIPCFIKYIQWHWPSKYEIDNIDKYYEICDRLVELFPIVESAYEDGNVTPEFQDFSQIERDNLYSTTDEIKFEIDKTFVTEKRFGKTDFADKIISFIYLHWLNLLQQIKLKVFPCRKISLII